MIKKVFLLVVLLLSNSSFANEVENLTNEYLHALKAQNFEKMASLMDHDAIKPIHKMLIAEAQKAEAEGKFEAISTGPFSQYKNASQIEAASAEDLYANLLKVGAGQDPDGLQILSNSEIKYVGVVYETEQRGYVVYKLKLDIEGYEMEVADILPITVREGKVSVSMGIEMEALVTAFQNELAKGI